MNLSNSSNQVPVERQKVLGLRLTLGLLLGGGALWLATRGVDWSQLWTALRSIELRWLWIALGCVFFNLVVLTVRWRLLFYPEHDDRGWVNLFRGIVVGQALNVVVPGRIGEFTRAYSTGASEGISKARVFGTIIVEKVMDMAALMAAILVFWKTIMPPGWAVGAGYALICFTSIATAVLLFMALRGETTLRWIGRFSALLPRRLGELLMKYGQMIMTGFSAIRYCWIQVILWGLSFLLLLLSVLTNYFLFKAFGLSLSLSVALFLLVVLQVGTAPPSLPGKLGVFHYLTVLSLSAFQVDRNIALAYSAVLYCVAILSKILIASVFIFPERVEKKCGGCNV